MDLIRFIFACFGIFANTIYSHHSFLFASKYSQKFEYKYSICCKTHTFLILANICFKIFVLKQIIAKLKANFTLKRKFDGKNSHTRKFSLRIASNDKGKPLTILDLN
jgi:hypothetical protein